jgi:hypothetical protein
MSRNSLRELFVFMISMLQQRFGATEIGEVQWGGSCVGLEVSCAIGIVLEIWISFCCREICCGKFVGFLAVQ